MEPISYANYKGHATSLGVVLAFDPEMKAKKRTLNEARKEVAKCRRCPLWENATQAVFGKGPSTAELMFVGEQPGDAEDVSGEPFVGPAGRLLRESLVDAGIDPAKVYLTNAVKHFKWKPKGKRRIHDRPNREEVLACRMWLEEEIALVKPRVLVALGATAAGSIIGSAAKVLRDRGRLFPSPLAPTVTLTVHPSSILRAPDDNKRAAARKLFVADLKRIARLLRSSGD